MRSIVALLLSFALATPSFGEGLRPLPRPLTVEVQAAFAAATPLAPRAVMRPRANPSGVFVLAVAAPRGPSGPARAPDPVGEPALALGAERSVTISASNARAPVFVTAAAALPRPKTRPAPDAAAEAPVRTAFVMPRPLPRPAAVVAAPRAKSLPAPTLGALLRPAPRPRGLAARSTATIEAPERVVKAAAVRIAPGEALVKPRKGALCGDPRIKGATIPPIKSAVQGCGIANPVRVTEVAGVRLSTPATLDCDTAVALRKWVETGLKPAAGKAGVAEIRVAAHYACRPRNNVRGARISEHGRGRAIDIAGITLANGKSLAVLGDYRRSEMLQKVRRAACGIFGTTLGPGSDRYHSDHFHFDTARHRNGPYCR